MVIQLAEHWQVPHRHQSLPGASLSWTGVARDAICVLAGDVDSRLDYPNVAKNASKGTLKCWRNIHGRFIYKAPPCRHARLQRDCSACVCSMRFAYRYTCEYMVRGDCILAAGSIRRRLQTCFATLSYKTKDRYVV